MPGLWEELQPMNQRKTSHTIVWKTYAHRLAGQPGCSPGCELHRASCPMPLACCSRQFYQHSSLGCLKSPLGLKEDLIQGTRSIFSCSLFLKSFQFSLDKALRLRLAQRHPTGAHTTMSSLCQSCIFGESLPSPPAPVHISHYTDCVLLYIHYPRCLLPSAIEQGKA